MDPRYPRRLSHGYNRWLRGSGCRCQSQSHPGAAASVPIPPAPRCRRRRPPSSALLPPPVAAITLVPPLPGPDYEVEGHARAPLICHS